MNSRAPDYTTSGDGLSAVTKRTRRVRASPEKDLIKLYTLSELRLSFTPLTETGIYNQRLKEEVAAEVVLGQFICVAAERYFRFHLCSVSPSFSRSLLFLVICAIVADGFI